jgi:hypothetical protein
MGMGAIFQDFTRCTNMKGRGQKSANKKREKRKESGRQQKNQSQFCLGYLAQDSRQFKHTVTTHRCDVSKYEIRILMTKLINTTLVVRRKMVGELLGIVSMLI